MPHPDGPGSLRLSVGRSGRPGVKAGIKLSADVRMFTRRLNGLASESIIALLSNPFLLLFFFFFSYHAGWVGGPCSCVGRFVLNSSSPHLGDGLYFLEVVIPTYPRIQAGVVRPKFFFFFFWVITRTQRVPSSGSRQGYLPKLCYLRGQFPFRAVPSPFVDVTHLNFACDGEGGEKLPVESHNTNNDLPAMPSSQ